ncbi:MAG TPA: hypothetical protein VIT68_01590 [Candidatus Gracilibacteria bacterium]
MTSTSRKVLVLVIVAVLVAAFLGYQQWRAQFVVPVQMHDTENGIFKNHPDNALPDKKQKSPADFL